MPDYPEAGVRLVADIDDYRDVMNEALQLASDFDSIGTIEVSVEADIDSAVNDIDSIGDESVTISVDIDQSSDLLDLESLSGETIETTVDPNVQETPSLLELEKLGDEPVEAEIETTEKGDQVGGKSILTTLHELGVNPVQVVMNIAGTILDGLRAIQSFTLDPILQLDEAVASVNAQTGNAIPNARELINGIFYDDLGDSIDQVGKLVIQAQQLGAPVEEATRAALEFTHTFQDANPSEVLTTLNTLVSTGLAPSFEDATNLLVTFYQTGGNKGGDALQTIQQYSQSWADMGLNGTEALSLVKSGLDGNISSANEAARALQTFDDALTAAASNPTSDQANILKQLGLENPKDKGETVGADFINSFSAAIANLPEDQQEVIINTFFGKGGKKYTGAFTDLSTTAIGTFDTIKGAASDAATEADNSLSGAIDDFTKAATKAAQDFLSSDAIDLPGKIEALKTGLQDALSTLEEGGTLGEALTVGLKPIGFDDEFQKLEDILGRFVIAILGVVADIQDVLGKDSSGTRQEVSRLSAQQLTYELQIANPDDFINLLNDAFQQGLNPEDYAGALEDSIKQLVDSGDFKKAQDLLDLANQTTVSVLPGQDVDQISADIQAVRDAAQALINSGKSAVYDPLSSISVGSQAGETYDPLSSIKSSADETAPSIDTLGTSTTNAAATMDAVSAAQTAASQTTEDYTGAVQQAALATSDFGQGLAAALAQAQSQINSLAASAGKGNAPSGGKASGGVASGTFMVGEEGREIMSTNPSVAVLNNETTEAIMSAISGTAGRGGVTSNSSKTVILNQVNQVPNQAVADSLGYATASQIRGV